MDVSVICDAGVRQTCLNTNVWQITHTYFVFSQLMLHLSPNFSLKTKNIRSILQNEYTDIILISSQPQFEGCNSFWV